MSDLIGFYALLPTADAKGYLGALLVTDDIGKPEEFRVTYPVKPNAVQKQLYGESLFPHIGVELCGVPLYQSLRSTPGVLLVNDERLLLLSQSLGCHVAYLSRLGESLQVADTNDQAPRRLASDNGRFNPIGLSFPREYAEDERREIEAELDRFFRHIDLLEPFSRVSAAVKELAVQKQEFA